MSVVEWKGAAQPKKRVNFADADTETVLKQMQSIEQEFNFLVKTRLQCPGLLSIHSLDMEHSSNCLTAKLLTDHIRGVGAFLLRFKRNSDRENFLHFNNHKLKNIRAALPPIMPDEPRLVGLVRAWSGIWPLTYALDCVLLSKGHDMMPNELDLSILSKLVELGRAWLGLVGLGAGGLISHRKNTEYKRLLSIPWQVPSS